MIKKRIEQTIKYKEYLESIADLTRRTKKPETGKKYPKEIKNEATRAFYDNLGKDTKLAVELDDDILYSMEDGFRGNFHKERALQVAVTNVLEKYGKEDKLPEVWNLIMNQKEYE